MLPLKSRRVLMPKSSPGAITDFKLPSPIDILDNTVRKLESERDFHATERDRYEAIIKDAQARLNNHLISLDAIEIALTRTEALNNIELDEIDV